MYNQDLTSVELGVAKQPRSPPHRETLPKQTIRRETGQKVDKSKVLCKL